MRKEGDTVRVKKSGKIMVVKRRIGDVLTLWLPKEDIHVIFVNIIVDTCILRVASVGGAMISSGLRSDKLSKYDEYDTSTNL